MASDEWSANDQQRFLEALYHRAAQDGDDPEDVADRVYEMLGGVSRRDVLAGGGVLGLGALLGGGGMELATGDAQAAASTTDSDGDIGTPNNPADVFADAVAVFDGANNQIGSFDETGIETPVLNTEEIHIDRRGNQVIEVPQDYETIQAAWDAVPNIIRQKYNINIDVSAYDDTQHEDLILDSVIGGYPATNEGGTANVIIKEIGGNTVNVGSIIVSGCYGRANPYLRNLKVNNVNPYDDENAGIAIEAGSNVAVSNGVEVGDLGTGNNELGIIVHSSSRVKLGGGGDPLTFGTSRVDHGVKVKGSGWATVRDNGMEGTVAQTAYIAENGIINLGEGIPRLDGDNEHISVGTNGIVFDRDANRIHGAKQDDEEKNLVNYDAQTGESVSITASGLSDDSQKRYIIEVLAFEDRESGSNNTLELTLGGLSSGDYDYTVADESLTATRQTDQDSFTLINPTASTNFDDHVGEWTLSPGRFGVPAIFGRGAAANRQQGQHLAKGNGGGQLSSPFDITISASASSGEEIRLEAAVWETIGRNNLI